jgi:hypothetical protein
MPTYKTLNRSERAAIEAQARAAATAATVEIALAEATAYKKFLTLRQEHARTYDEAYKARWDILRARAEMEA